MTVHISAYQIEIYDQDRPQRQVLCLLGESPPTPSSTAGDWNVVALPKRSAVTVWQGRSNLMLMDLPIVLGGSTSRDPEPVTDQLTRLLEMWRPSDDTEQPAIVRIGCRGDAVPYRTLPWVINDIQWADAQGDQESWRVMQKLTLQLMEYRPDERLQTINVKAQKWSKHRTYVVKRGDTLTSIARRFKLKDWRELADAQHPKIRDPRNIRVGEKLTIP